MDVNAVYIANTAPIDLVQNQIAASTQAIRNTYLQKLPFEVRFKNDRRINATSACI